MGDQSGRPRNHLKGCERRARCKCAPPPEKLQHNSAFGSAPPPYHWTPHVDGPPMSMDPPCRWTPHVNGPPTRTEESRPPSVASPPTQKEESCSGPWACAYDFRCPNLLVAVVVPFFTQTSRRVAASKQQRLRHAAARHTFPADCRCSLASAQAFVCGCAGVRFHVRLHFKSGAVGSR